MTISDNEKLQKKGFTISVAIGEGAYSNVMRATWSRKNHDAVEVALKIVNTKTAPDGYVDKFLPREVDVMRNITHPNLIQLLELFEISDKLYFVLEWAGRGDLLQYILLCGPLKETKSRPFFHQLCEGLQYLHGKGMIHRDLKCENILLLKGQRLKIADFGFARTFTPDDLCETYCGSAAYCAPELLQEIPYEGPLADIWSLGVVLYVMACASFPFRDSSITGLLKDQKKALNIPSITRVKDFSPLLTNLLSRILEWDPKRRYQMAAIMSHSWYVAKRVWKSDENTPANGNTSNR